MIRSGIAVFRRHRASSKLTKGVKIKKSFAPSISSIRLFSGTDSSSEDNNETNSNTIDKPRKNRVLIHPKTKDGIRHVELNRPEKMNSLDMDMFHSIAAAAKQMRNDKHVRVVIISGKGRAFCSGLDVKSIIRPSTEHGRLPMTKINRLLERPSGYGSDADADDHDDDGDGDGEDAESNSGKSVEVDPIAMGNLCQDICYLWRDVPVPVIAVLNGICFGGGFQLALGADMRYSTPDCKLSIMESKWGMIPDMGASVTLRELVRIDVAKELTYTGKIISGSEAEELGLVTRCCDDPMEEAWSVARSIASKSPDCVAAAKIMYQSTWTASEKECLEMETKLQKQMLPSYNQTSASLKNFGVDLPYMDRKDLDK